MSKRKKLTVHIHGFGPIVVRKPKRYDEETYMDGVADAVKKTMQLVHPNYKSFHPVLRLQGPLMFAAVAATAAIFAIYIAVVFVIEWLSDRKRGRLDP